MEQTADELFKMKEAAHADLKALHEYVNGQPSSTPWFFNTITALLRALAREYRYLNIGYAKDGGLLAWACRNLLEINLYTQFSLRSAANAKAFADDQIIDALDIFGAFKKWLMVGDPEPTTPILDRAIDLMEEAKTLLGVTRTKYLRTEDIAKTLGRLEKIQAFQQGLVEAHPSHCIFPVGRWRKRRCHAEAVPVSDRLVLFRGGMQIHQESCPETWNRAPVAVAPVDSRHVTRPELLRGCRSSAATRLAGF